MVIKGTVSKIVFQNRENGYTVADISCEQQVVTIVGSMPNVGQGQSVVVNGKFITSLKWGEQFSVSSYEIVVPSSAEGVRKYLSSGLIYGVGPATANAIVDFFGEKTLDVIEFNPLKLAEVRGISINKAAEIGKSFLQLKNMQDAVMFLQEHNITTNLAIKIFGVYQKDTIKVVQTNPYKLVEDVSRIGFATADAIAQKMGIALDSEFRIRAGVLHVLKEASKKDGNTYLPKFVLLENLKKLLNLDIDLYQNVVEDIFKQLMFDGSVKEAKFENEPCIMLEKYYFVEKKLAQNLIRLKEQADDQNLDLSSEISEFERKNGITFHDTQKNAIKLAVNKGVCVITGGPGTGKTTIIRCILNILQLQRKKVALLAPTGRAAKRMSESCGQPASTIHRALMVDRAKMDARDDEDDAFFVYNEKNRFPYDVVIVDEFSMVDSILASNLLKALKMGCKLLLVGDKNQLPSVGAGNVLADILNSGKIDWCNLTQIYRQSEKSLIVTNAHLINMGQMPQLDNSSRDFFFEYKKDQSDVLSAIIDLQSKRIPTFMGIEPLKIQVLAPMRSGVCGVENLNNCLQQVLNPQHVDSKEVYVGKTIFRLNDKVMQTVNNYELAFKKQSGNMWEYGEGVFNGDIGFITDVNRQIGSVEVTFEDGRIAEYSRADIGQLTLSYAITVHKSQGSEFDVVIMPIVGGAPTILTRNLLYTAVTRAKKMVVLVGQKYQLKIMVDNNYTAKRYSALKFFLDEQSKNMEMLLSWLKIKITKEKEISLNWFSTGFAICFSFQI